MGIMGSIGPPEYWCSSPKKKFSHYLISLMLMESEAKFLSVPNISGASQQNGIAAFS